MQDLFKHLPRQRRLPKSLKSQASAMLAMNSNRKLVQSKMMEESGNVVLLKDLSNISAKSSQGSTRNNLESVVQTLTEKYSKDYISLVLIANVIFRCYCGRII